jgi:CelD/BcsL family acetyltransferase involved in cellulose biosynthesis
LSDWSEANSSLIKKVHYYQRRQGRTGVVQAKRYVGGTPADWPRIINELAQIEANSWISKEGDPKVTSDADKTFWRRLLERDETRDMIVIWILYYETRPISFSLQIEAASIMHIIANTYDEEFKENSPGHVLTYHVIKDAIERKILSIEWGLGDSGFKQRWMAKPGRTFVDVIALPPGLVGRMSARLVERYSGFSFSAPSTAARKRFEHGAPA